MNQSEKDFTPKRRPYRNPDEEILRWQKSEKREPSNYGALPREYHTCKTSFDELKPIMLNEMEVPKIHKGHYLVCKIIAKPIAVIEVKTLIQDLNGDVEEVDIYNFRYKLDDIDWASPGTILIIKEPWLQYGSNSKTVALKVDSPSDIIIVDPTDDLLLESIGAMKWFKLMSTDAEFWREKANESFKKGKFDEALMLYDRAIRYNPEMAVLYLNKSLTCLKMDAFHSAFEAAKLGLEKGGDREKALYRMGLAAYGMREWEKAANNFLKVLKEFPKNSVASEQLKRATSRLAEQRHGKYNLKEMFIESKNGKGELDVADYKGPIEIATIPGKGRGIIATKDIEKGTLLVVSKAFASGYIQDFPDNLILASKTIKNNSNTLTHILCVIKSIQNLKNNPLRAKEFYDLYAGDTVEDEEIPFGINDAARIDSICMINSFGTANGSNGYENRQIFLLPSYFNHSCLANADKTFYGDVLVIHATMPIKRGEEILINYISPMKEYSIRKGLLNGWKFECQCELCEIEKEDDMCFKRDKLLQIFDKCATDSEYGKSFQVEIEIGEKILKKIRESYGSRKKFQTTLAQMLKNLARLYTLTGNFRPAIKYLEEAITLLDDRLKYPFHIVHTEKVLALCYAKIGNWKKASEMYQKALESSFCVDKELSDMIYPAF